MNTEFGNGCGCALMILAAGIVLFLTTFPNSVVEIVKLLTNCKVY